MEDTSVVKLIHAASLVAVARYAADRIKPGGVHGTDFRNIDHLLRDLADYIEHTESKIAELTAQRDEAREQLSKIGRKAFWAAKPSDRL